MNVQDYKAAGYGLSQLIDQAVVTRAENEVITAYIEPLLGHVPTANERDTEPIKTAIMSLAFLLIQERNSTVTRAGAKNKLSEQSSTPTIEDVIRQNAPACQTALRKIDEYAHRKCNDICRVFFSTIYFHNN